MYFLGGISAVVKESNSESGWGGWGRVAILNRVVSGKSYFEKTPEMGGSLCIPLGTRRPGVRR
jgi:hypothetical protein